ncbi:integrase [Enterococcus sp. 10A9_DIV0425]|uniref:Integrase n=1 Tax=Candidatus Enterococcus wittei TaxID=1987383 RepID=A0A242JXE6_9ENTE|nr:IS30 family transposase [Enterococcus sp. 10A9_DIV0425]OTP09997.1 integrase [Enterococcus sp. 10A9_DIV0425]
MTYTHLTTDELVLIASYFNIDKPVALVAQSLNRSRQTIYNVYSFLKQGKKVLDYYRQYKQNKSRCGRHSTVLSDEQSTYVQEKVAQGWSPDVIIGRSEFPIDCSARTLYRMFKKGLFDTQSLPMKGKRKPNNHQEKRGKQAFRRTIHERNSLYPHEGDTIVGVKHKSAVITLVECLSKVIITLKPIGRRAEDIETRLNDWFKSMPKHLFKSMTFDCGKEFSNWRSISNSNDIAIFFADPGTPSQRRLNEHSNGLLRRDGLPKTMDFRDTDETFIQSVASKRNHIPRKSLNYQTPLEVFLSCMDKDILSSLI